MIILKVFRTIICLILIAHDSTQINGEVDQNGTLINVDDINKPSLIADVVMNNILNRILEVDVEKHEKLQQLKKKLQQIFNYEINRDKFTQILHNEAKAAIFNHSSFYDALNTKDDLNYLTERDPKNVYVQIKQKMNRNDLITVLNNNNIAINKKLLHTLDKILIDSHHDEASHKNFSSIYWDPTANPEHVSGRRIFNGERTYIKNFPFVASVHVMGRFFCGGSIISADMVVTSAACLQLMHNNRFYREIPYVLQVRIGSNFSRIGGEKIEALEVFFHPGYNPRSLDHNLALIRLDRAINFRKYRTPKAIELSRSKMNVPTEIRVRLLGWGLTRVSQKLRYEPVYLQQKLVSVFPNFICADVYGSKFKGDRMFCAGSVTVGDGACEHDAGGPAIFNGYLLGVISYGSIACGAPDAPTVFTHIGHYSDWINETIASIPEYHTGYKKTTTTVAFDSTTKNIAMMTPAPTTKRPPLSLRHPQDIEDSDGQVTKKTYRAQTSKKPKKPQKQKKTTEDMTSVWSTQTYGNIDVSSDNHKSSSEYISKPTHRSEESKSSEGSDFNPHYVHNRISNEIFKLKENEGYVKVYDPNQNLKSSRSSDEGPKSDERSKSNERSTSDERFVTTKKNKSSKRLKTKEKTKKKKNKSDERYKSSERLKSNERSSERFKSNEFKSNERYKSNEKSKSIERYKDNDMSRFNQETTAKPKNRFQIYNNDNGNNFFNKNDRKSRKKANNLKFRPTPYIGSESEGYAIAEQDQSQQISKEEPVVISRRVRDESPNNDTDKETAGSEKTIEMHMRISV